MVTFNDSKFVGIAVLPILSFPFLSGVLGVEGGTGTEERKVSVLMPRKGVGEVWKSLLFVPTLSPSFSFACQLLVLCFTVSNYLSVQWEVDQELFNWVKE